MKAIIWAAVSTAVQANEDEKVSLPQQEADGRTLCQKNNWQILDVLRVPGHSRRYIDIHECAHDMLKQDINAFERLLRYWDQRNFDILIVRDASRFARTQALHAYVTERTIDIGARIYSMADGWVDENNYRMWIAMGGYSASTEIDRLVKYRKAAMTKRAERGLPTGSSVIISHKLIRDEIGKPIKLVVDESKRRLFDDAAELILQGIGWNDIEGILYTRFGHTKADGKPYPGGTFNKLLYNPTFWGNSAQNFREKQGKKYGTWAFDPAEPVPDGVTIFYNTHEPVWDGDLAARIQAEMRRRREVVRGRTRPGTTNMFAGLFLCGHCSYYMTTYIRIGYIALRCMTRYIEDREIECLAPLFKYQHAQDYLDQRLREMLAAGGPEMFMQDTSQADTEVERIAALKREITDLEQQINRMILKQSSASEAVHDLYDAQIEAAGEKLKILRGNLSTLHRYAISNSVRASQEHAFAELLGITIDLFWQQPHAKINQILHQLVGTKRFVVENAEITGVTEAPNKWERWDRLFGDRE
jgi:DNA invertase Pin-like site-specific DNA recombinase/CII-binding regulator of phage lambda lysogenization HflD